MSKSAFILKTTDNEKTSGMYGGIVYSSNGK